MMLTFMACSLACPRVPDAVRREAMRRRAGTCSISVDVGPGSAARHKRAAQRPGHELNPRRIELRLLAGAVAAQCALFAHRIRPLEDPVLPGGEAREDFRFHGLWPDEAQVCFHAGQPIGREAGALLEK